MLLLGRARSGSAGSRPSSNFAGNSRLKRIRVIFGGVNSLSGAFSLAEVRDYVTIERHEQFTACPVRYLLSAGGISPPSFGSFVPRSSGNPVKPLIKQTSYDGAVVATRPFNGIGS